MHNKYKVSVSFQLYDGRVGDSITKAPTQDYDELMDWFENEYYYLK